MLKHAAVAPPSIGGHQRRDAIGRVGCSRDVIPAPSFAGETSAASKPTTGRSPGPHTAWHQPEERPPISAITVRAPTVSGHSARGDESSFLSIEGIGRAGDVEYSGSDSGLLNGGVVVSGTAQM